MPHDGDWLKIPIFIITHFRILGVIFLEPSGSTDSCSRLSDGSSGDEIATMFCSRLRNYFILDDSICAADEVSSNIIIYIFCGCGFLVVEVKCQYCFT